MQNIKRISKIESFDGEIYVRVYGDDDNWFLFEKQSFCKDPIVDYPISIYKGIAKPLDKYDAQIDLKYHLIIIKKVKNANHIEVQSLTTGSTYTIKLTDFRPLIIK